MMAKELSLTRCYDADVAALASVSTNVIQNPMENDVENDEQVR
jgi:hypothetical protein